MKDFSSYSFYSEYPDLSVGERQRTEYLESIERYLAKLRAESGAKREAYMSPASYRADPGKYRRDYYEMLGEPLSSYRRDMPVPKAVVSFVASDEMCDIYRVQLEVMPEFLFYGLYFVPISKRNGKTGLVVCQHGGGGAPELCSDMMGPNNYSHITHRICDRDLRVFAPQILVWGKVPGGHDNAEILPSLGNKRQLLDRALKQMGSSIQALETFSIMRSLDYFCREPLVDENKLGMVGLSYGGFYTLMTAAADERIVSAYSCCAMNDRFKYDWFDWTWRDSGNRFTDERVAALVAPRRFYGEAGREDPVFAADSVPDFNALVKPFYAAFGAEDEFRFNIWNGGHRIDTDDGAGFDFFVEKLI